MTITLLEAVFYGFLAVAGVLVASYVIGEIASMYRSKQINESFERAIDEMTKSTVVAIESIKDTTTTGINALLNMDTLRDVNSLAKEKTKEQGTTTQTK